MRIGSILGLLGVAGLAASAIACTSLLGDFSVSADVCPVGQTFVGGACVEGTGDGGPAAASCTEPAAPQCGAHGTCEDTSGIAACKCALGYAGPSCSTCSAGYGGAGTCEPICETACPPHGSCVVTNGKGACSCAPGYTAKSSACEWTGGPTDPGFEKPEPGPWDVTGGTVDPAAIGREDGDKGAFIVPAESLCGRPPALGSVAQKVVMPSVTQGEPFAMKVVGRTYCDDVASRTCDGNAGYESALSFPGTFFSAPKVWTEQEICLGEKAYGPDVRVGVGRVRPDPGGHPGLCYQHMAGQ